MSALINVNREVDDEFFRYKMPRIIAKVEGKGNGIKTVIVNMADVAKALYRQPTFPTKYFGCELGAQTQFDLKNDRFIVNGQHDAAKLQDLLDGFIRKFVLCSNCSNPETDLTVKARKNEVHAKCKACGHVYMIDPVHRLTTFIIKNPPEGAGKKGSKKTTVNKAKGANGGDSPEREDAEETDEVAGDTSAVAVADDDWGSDCEEFENGEHLSEAVKNMVLDVDLADKTTEERANMFHAFVQKRFNGGQVIGREKELVDEADRLDIRDKAVVILLEVLMTEPSSYLEQIRRFRKAFLHFTVENERAQKYLLGALEKLIGEHRDFFLPRVSKLLLELYEVDILTEEVIIDWAEKGPSKRYVERALSKKIHENAAKVVEWLRNASDDEEEDDDDDSDNEDEQKGIKAPIINNTQSVLANGKPHPQASNGGGAAADLEQDSDIDIDDI